MSTTPRPSQPATAPVGFIVVASVATLLYLVMLANMSESLETDAAGRGLAQAFAAIVGFILWILLGVLLMIGAARGRMPLAATLAAVVLLPLSAWAAAVAGGLYSSKNDWPYYVLVLLPPLFAAYALWARLPQLHRVLRPFATTALAGALVMALTAAPFAARWYAERPDPERDARLAAEFKARQEADEKRLREEREREAADFAKLSPDSSLMDYLRFTGTSMRDQAYRDMKKVKSRQADIVMLLQKKGLEGSPSLMLLDLQPTAEVCEAYGTALAGAASQIAKTGGRSDYITAAIDLEFQVPTIQWLTTHDCNLDESLTLAATNIRAVSDSDRLIKDAARLETFRKAK